MPWPTSEPTVASAVGIGTGGSDLGGLDLGRLALGSLDLGIVGWGIPGRWARPSGPTVQIAAPAVERARFLTKPGGHAPSRTPAAEASYADAIRPIHASLSLQCLRRASRE